MTKERQYVLELGMSDKTDIEEIEETLQDLLLELYEQGQVESVHVTKAGVPDTKDVNKLIEIIDTVETEHIRRAIDSVKELEDVDDE